MPNFFTPEHDAFRKSVRSWVERELTPHALEWDRAGIFPKELFTQAGELGFNELSLAAIGSGLSYEILRRYVRMAKTYATTRIPTHQASAIQMPLPTGCWANRSRMALTIDVTGWFSAKARTGPGMVSVSTNAELMNGRKMSG